MADARVALLDEVLDPGRAHPAPAQVKVGPEVHRQPGGALDVEEHLLDEKGCFADIHRVVAPVVAGSLQAVVVADVITSLRLRPRRRETSPERGSGLSSPSRSATFRHTGTGALRSRLRQ